MTKAVNNLRGKYAVVGVGETEFSRNSGRTTRRMGVEAIRNAVHDSGLGWDDTSWGMMAYGSNDRAFSDQIAQDLGIQLDYHVDIFGGGNSTETMIGAAIGALEGGLADAFILYRTMNGYTEARIGGTPVGEAPPPMFPTAHGSSMLHQGIYGVGSALQMFGLSFVRHMWEYGTTLEQLAHVKVAHSKGASNNPKAYYKNRYTVDDVLNSRLIVWPFGLLHCCVETDNATAIVITDIERAKSLQHPPATILGTAGRTHKYGPEYHWGYGPINRHAGIFGREILWPNAGVQPHEVDVTGSYDAFTFTALFQLEAYGFCDFGEGGDYVSNGTIELGGARPNNPSGGHLCEGYTHGMNMVVENVRQLRGTVDDYCPNWADGEHSHDYSEGHCRQVENAQLTANLGWGMPSQGSALVMTNQV